MGNDSALTYHQLKISPFELVNLQELTITKKFNEHAYFTFKGMIPEELKDSYVSMSGSDTPVVISQMDEEGQSAPLFCGLIQKISISSVRDIYYLNVEGISYTYLLDLEKKRRSFQNKKMTYTQLLETMTSEYPNLDILNAATDGKTPLGHFTLQYEETDWQFLRRIASRFRTGLMPAAGFDTPKVCFGLLDGSSKGELSNFNYKVRKRMDAYRLALHKPNLKVAEDDFVYYEVESPKVFDLGNAIEFKGKQLYVFEAYTVMKNGLLTHRYILSTREGLRQPTYFNDQIIGASIQGKVIDVTKDQVKLHLDMDASQKPEEAHWFRYSSMYTAEGNTGWYCMPEKGDHVRIYFPGNKEEDGFATSSMRTQAGERGSDKLGNPNIKYFRTPSGKELMFSPEEIVITGKDGEIFIRLSEKDGIEISSSLPIQLNTPQDLVMNADQSIVFSAKEEIRMSCKESQILLNGNTKIVGTELRTN
ncbi:hypothetical protein J25TS5_16220 [Paenibacillus faecis]|uniref:contractile injection system protein, VgrG/Pvc8 family n=1 Tax=Paenibacillus faecis TaxID=862114 RepID=UPI001B135D37|nr:contractile injection system protein, VgrG/Pvc8 family [Paenibacillus faecis]GIO84690.1 hypothetical protein J25TS5_16220 [Paenibacillus faecis]